MKRIAESEIWQYLELRSPIGRLRVYEHQDAIKAVLWDGETSGRVPLPRAKLASSDHALLNQARTQLEAYFRGKLDRFDLPLNPDGTVFQKSVWKELVKIPSGQTRSYGDLAHRLGRPRASRAVGAANGRNPIGILIPCHRVIGADGSLTGFAGGIETKRWLLDHEKGQVSANRG